jgi:hypothetical protein
MRSSRNSPGPRALYLLSSKSSTYLRLPSRYLSLSSLSISCASGLLERRSTLSLSSKLLLERMRRARRGQRLYFEGLNLKSTFRLRLSASRSSYSCSSINRRVRSSFSWSHKSLPAERRRLGQSLAGPLTAFRGSQLDPRLFISAMRSGLRAATARKQSSLSLPSIDDFTTPEHQPAKETASSSASSCSQPKKAALSKFPIAVLRAAFDTSANARNSRRALLPPLPDPNLKSSSHSSSSTERILFETPIGCSPHSSASSMQSMIR